jgi:hypothetical protein
MGFAEKAINNSEEIREREREAARHTKQYTSITKTV